jgi:hypothetical protein
VIEYAPDLFLEESAVRFYGFRLKTRMTLIRLDRQHLFVHSPVFLTPELRRAVDALGRVTCVVSPNKIHHQAIGQWLEAYPEARSFASPGLPARCPDLHFDAVLGDEPDPLWADELDQVATAGNVFFSEILFFHRASRSLLVADLVENLDERTLSAGGRALARLFGVGDRAVASPEFRMYTLDAEAAAASLQRAQAWEFERIVLCHGALVERNAKEAFRTVCDELLATSRRRGGLARRLLTGLARLQ